MPPAVPPVPPLKLTDPPDVDPSPEDIVSAPPALDADDSEVKDATHPVPELDRYSATYRY